jgi:hypothetical protein
MFVVYLNPLRKAIMTRVWGLRASGCRLAGEASVPGRLDGQDARPSFFWQTSPRILGLPLRPRAGSEFADLADLLLVETVWQKPKARRQQPAHGL